MNRLPIDYITIAHNQFVVYLISTIVYGLTMNKSSVQLKKAMGENERRGFEELCDRYCPDSHTYMFKEGQ